MRVFRTKSNLATTAIAVFGTVRRGGVWHFPLYDANGNITAYISESGAVSATYAYGPFGETIAHTGMDFEHRSTRPCGQACPRDRRFAGIPPCNHKSECAKIPYVHKKALSALLMQRVLHWKFAGGAKNKVIKVAKFHAYLYIGQSNKKYPIKWDMPTDGGAFGGAICCWPGINIPHETDWVWPDNPDLDDLVLEDEGFYKNVNKINEVTFFPNLETNPNNILSNIWSEVALNKIIDKLSSEPYCCKEIWFEIEVGKDKIGETIINNLVKRFNWQQGEIRKFHYRVEVKNGK